MLKQDHSRGKPFEKQRMARLLMSANRCFGRMYHNLTVRSACRLPRRGAAILVCNHTSGLDPILIQSVCDRLIVWMMASEYYEHPGLSWFFRRFDAIPVQRSGRDLSATRQALRALADGKVLGIFPEGRIEPSRQILPFQTGVAMMALRTGVSVYPAYLDGTQRGTTLLQAYLKPQQATLAFGDGLDLSKTPNPQSDLESATKRIQQAVEVLQQRFPRHIDGKTQQKGLPNVKITRVI